MIVVVTGCQISLIIRQSCGNLNLHLQLNSKLCWNYDIFPGWECSRLILPIKGPLHEVDTNNMSSPGRKHVLSERLIQSKTPGTDTWLSSQGIAEEAAIFVFLLNKPTKGH